MASRREAKYPAAHPQHGCRTRHEVTIQSNGPQCDHVHTPSKVAACGDFLESAVLYLHIRQAKLPNRLPQERRLANLCFNEHETTRGMTDLQRNRRRPATGSDVENRLVARNDVSPREERLNQQPIDRLVVRRIDCQRRQVESPVPAGEQLDIGGQPTDDAGGQRQAGGRRAPLDVLRKRSAPRRQSSPIPGSPGSRPASRRNHSPGRGAYLTAGGMAGRRATRAATMARAAGVTPGTRPAWPIVDGRIAVSRSTTSRDSPGMPVVVELRGNRPRFLRHACAPTPRRGASDNRDT